MSLEPGTVFAHRFIIEQLSNTGGMGAIFRAYDQLSQQAVALKVLHKDSLGPAEDERFEREAQLLSELVHPGIVSYVAHGVSDGGARFLAMEWLAGEDLASRLRRGPLSIKASVGVLSQVSAALAHAHARGVVHRDLKPSNLFLSDSSVERVKLIDFGIARRALAYRVMTGTGMIVGTPDYMAPEQARGDRRITAAADVFSLGCVLYECLAGRPPFAAQHLAAVLVRILLEDPEPIVNLRPGVPAPLAALLTTMLTKAPAGRPADAAALGDKLQALAELSDDEPASLVPGAAQPAGPPRLSDQGLLCVVLASTASQTRYAETQAPAVAPEQEPRHLALAQALLSLAGQVEWMLDGSLVIVCRGVGHAVDQAAIAARAALLVREHWPEVQLVLVTGRGEVQANMPIGQAAEQAALLLQLREPLVPSGEIFSGIWLDELSARLLDRQFAIVSHGGCPALIGENKDLDAARPLLGMPTSCVGRETELATLAAQFSGCVQESEVRVVMLTAPPGVGKSRLLHEFLHRLEAQHQEVTILWGHGEPLSDSSPGHLLKTAMRRLCGFSTRDTKETQVQRLQQRLIKHLDPSDADRVTGFLVELCGLSAKAGPPGDALLAARRDHKLMREQLQRALTDWLAAEAKQAALLLILDDLHWGDALSVTLIEYATRILAGTPTFILALARPEVHQLFPKIFSGHHRQEIVLKELSKRACEQLAQQALGSCLSVAPGGKVPKELVALLYEQSGGNALLLEELIRAAVEGKTPQQSETAIAIIQTRYERFTHEARQILSAASIFGETFVKSGLAALLRTGAPAVALDDHLSRLVSEEVIQIQSGAPTGGEVEYRFRHALLREAAYGLLTDSARAAGHRLAGNHLLMREEHDPTTTREHRDSISESRRTAWLERRVSSSSDDSLFKIVVHLNQGAMLLASPEERLALARLDERAGHIAKSKTAYAMAAQLFATALGLLDDTVRQRERALFREISIHYAESLYRSGQAAAAEAVLDQLDGAASSGLELAPTAAIRIELHQAAGQFARAVSAGRAALGALGILLPESEQELARALELELAFIMQQLSSRQLTELAELPALHEPLRLAELDLLMRLDTPAFPVSRTLSALVSAKQVSLSLRHGHASGSAVCYMALAVLLARLRGEFALAHRLGEFALLLNARSKSLVNEARLRYLYGSFLPFVRPLKEAIIEQQRAFAVGTSLGEMQGYFAATYVLFFRILAGDPVSEVLAESEQALILIRRTGNDLATTLQRIGLQVLKCLAGMTHGPSSLSDQHFDEAVELSPQRCQAIPTARLWYYLCKLMLFLLSDELSMLWQMALQAEESAAGAAGLFIIAELSFYYCLAGLRHCSQLPADARGEILAKLVPHRDKITALAKDCPVNFACKRELINAEWALLNADVEAATAAYEQAIAQALQAGLPSCGALAAARAAKMSRGLGCERAAAEYLSRAQAELSKWGLARRADLLGSG